MKPNLHTPINAIILGNRKSQLMIMSYNLNTTIGAYMLNALVNCAESDFIELQHRFDLLMETELKLKSSTKTISSTGEEVVLNWYVYEDPQYHFQVIEFQV